MMSNTKKLVFSALLSALALISFLLESLLPPLFIPGARIGLSNVFILLSLIILGTPYAFITLIIKIVLGSVFSGNLSTVLYSLPAGLISLSIQALLIKKVKLFSLPAVSVTGAVLSNAVQNTVFCLITGLWEYFLYLPYLSLLGVLSGLIIGFTVYFAIKFLPVKIYDKI